MEILSLLFFVLFVIWAIRLETNSYKVVNHLKNIEDLLSKGKKGDK